MESLTMQDAVNELAQRIANALRECEDLTDVRVLPALGRPPQDRAVVYVSVADNTPNPCRLMVAIWPDDTEGGMG